MYNVVYGFFPVGQGLFSYGAIISEYEEKEVFSWVYDCGTSSKIKLVEESVDELEKIKKRSNIDIIFISHYDEDHINGIDILLNVFSASLLVLPYISFEDIVVQIGMGNFQVGGKALDMALDPAGYLLKKGLSLKSIILVPPDKGVEEDIESETVELDDGGEITFSYQGKFFEHHVPIYIKDLHGPLSFVGIWDFYTYNAPLKKMVSDELRQRIKLHKNNKNICHESLKKLGKMFSEEHGKSSRSKNIISTYAFGTPASYVDKTIPQGVNEVFDRSIINFNGMCNVKGGQEDSGFGILYTGDGSLRSKKDMNNFKKSSLLNQAKNDCLCFQVMHHGAESGFNKDVPSLLNPSYSVISSDPSNRGYNHPHKDVILSLYKNRIVQVDKDSSFFLSYSFILCPP